jgi:hypothetical protein
MLGVEWIRVGRRAGNRGYGYTVIEEYRLERGIGRFIPDGIGKLPRYGYPSPSVFRTAYPMGQQSDALGTIQIFHFPDLMENMVPIMIGTPTVGTY